MEFIAFTRKRVMNRALGVRSEEHDEWPADNFSFSKLSLLL